MAKSFTIISLTTVEIILQLPWLIQPSLTWSSVVIKNYASYKAVQIQLKLLALQVGHHIPVEDGTLCVWHFLKTDWSDLSLHLVLRHAEPLEADWSCTLSKAVKEVFWIPERDVFAPVIWRSVKHYIHSDIQNCRIPESKIKQESPTC